MLTLLSVKDYALIENIEISFGNNLNIITGETGAGKSILLSAMSLLLGERASPESVRKGAKKSVVEGFFKVDGNKSIKKILAENEIEYSPELIIRREISALGSSRAFVNDTPATLNVLKDIGNILVDLHGQHDHQSLLRTETHIEFLDDYGSYKNEIILFRHGRSELIQKTNEYEKLKMKERELKEKYDLYKFQLDEINSINPQENEESEIQDELKILENSEKLMELSSVVYEALYDSEDAAYEKLVAALKQLDSLSSIDNSLREKSKQINEAIALIDDVSSFIRSYKDKIESDPEKLEILRERLGAFNLLKKKYGGTIEKVIELKTKLQSELDLTDNYDDQLTKIKNEIDELRNKLGKTALSLSAERKVAAKQIEKGVLAELKELGIENGTFKISFEHLEPDGENNFVMIGNKKIGFDTNGIDKVEFYISTNIGEDAKPLVKVASGGEISRIMLALKSVLAKNENLPLLIFDEIDTGVSGRIAQKVGKALKNLAEQHQIITITHLPQIAAQADHHFSVEKIETNGRVSSSIRKLTQNQSINEIAKLISGDEITDSALKKAKEFITSS
ncbi:MAG: DNA repair protein RecN [Melioribacteraceae bacterium]|nr:DNA repair protein RecN [Melioribacteraceae bacterium]